MSVKQPNAVVYFDQPKLQDDLTGGDFQQLISFMCAFIGTWMKSKLSIWIALFFLFSSFANMKSRSANYLQLVINLGLIIMGFFSLYIWIPNQIRQQQLQEQASASQGFQQ